MKLTMISNVETFGSPFAPKQKCWIIPLVLGASALAGGAASIINTSRTNAANARLNEENIGMQRETNALNAELQREVNAQNYQVFQEQNAFNLDMWNKQNAYNDPKEQVRRLLAAGINPSAGLGQAAQAGSLASAGFNGAVAPTMQSPRNYYEMRPTDFTGITDAGIQAVNAYNSSRLVQSEVKNKDALTAGTAMDNSFRARTMADSIKILQEEAKGKGVMSEIAKKQLDFIQATQDYDIAMKYGDMTMQQKNFEMMTKKLEEQQLNNDILQVTRAYASKLNEAQLQSIWSSVYKAKSEIGLIEANKMLTNAQRETEIQKRIGTLIDNGLKGIDFKVKDAVKGCLVKDQQNRTKMLGYDASMQGVNDLWSKFAGIIPFAGGYKGRAIP